MKLNYSLKINELTFCISLIFSLFAISIMNGQTQKPSIQSGVTFQWANVQTNRFQPSVLESITVDGILYDIMVVPTSYELTRLGPDGHNRNAIEDGSGIVSLNSSSPTWNADALAAFQDRDLTHYFTSNKNGDNFCSDFGNVSSTDSQIQTLRYSPGIPSNEGGIIAITERQLNNCFYIAFYGEPAGGGTEVFLGDTFVLETTQQNGPRLTPVPPAPGSDYWNSGRVVANNGSIGVALFDLEDLAPVGSIITRVDLMAASNDHGDGKMLILQEFAVVKEEEGCRNQTFFGTVKDDQSPDGSTFNIVTQPSPTGQGFTLSSNGDYSYTPSSGFTGEVTFKYEVCLPAPNTGTCDTETVEITFVSDSVNCTCTSGGADAPSLQN